MLLKVVGSHLRTLRARPCHVPHLYLFPALDTVTIQEVEWFYTPEWEDSLDDETPLDVGPLVKVTTLQSLCVEGHGQTDLAVAHLKILTQLKALDMMDFSASWSARHMRASAQPSNPALECWIRLQRAIC